MFKEIVVHACFGERTGYQIHASRFFPELDKLVREAKGNDGEVHISLLDTVSASNTDVRHPAPSILFNVWESTEQPAAFMQKLELYDQVWVPSEWQRSCMIAQGVPEEFIKVVPEGVDASIYKLPDAQPDLNPSPFVFVHVGQWQPRKSTLEICQAFINAFPIDQYPDVFLSLSADTLFPSDEYKSTEERLEAYGVNDPRIVPIHFEERKDYVERLQGAQCFVSCSRSEGWGLPIIEAIACGVPAIVADFGGSTEYAKDAINVRIKELRKPHGIYGGWDVPGEWGEPDYGHLAECMKMVYENYGREKAKAIELSHKIRTEFSWEAAAKKAVIVLEELCGKKVEAASLPPATEGAMAEMVSKMSPETEITVYARKLGYEVSLRKSSTICSIDCHPSSPERIETLAETIKQVKAFGFPVLVVSHLPIPSDVMELCDYFIYDKNDPLSWNDMPVYYRTGTDGKRETIDSKIPCHALAGHRNIRNAIDFCRGRFDWIYQMNSDVEVDFEDWLSRVRKSDKGLITAVWEHDMNTFGCQIIAGRTELLDKMFFPIETWEEYAYLFGRDRFCSERGYYKIARDIIGLDNVEFLDIPLGNRFDQVDRTTWPDDIYHVHFVEGPCFHVSGISGKEYVTEFVSKQGDKYVGVQKSGMWTRAPILYFRDWEITSRLGDEIIFNHKLDLRGQRVMIGMGSKALGDTIAWMPYIEEFRKKHGCKIIQSGWWQDVFDYPEWEMVPPGSAVENLYASYSIGCYDDQLDKNVKNWRCTPLQQVASDILGLEFEPLRAKLKFTPNKKGNGKRPKPYVCFSEFSTMKNKLWNRPGAWQKIVDHLLSLGYDCISISAEPTNLRGVIKHNSQAIQSTIADIDGCEFYIGLNHGPAWIAYALGKPCIMITGVAEEWNDFPNPYRIAINNDVCGIGCFNDPTLPINRGWEWCPREKDYACTSKITEAMVMDMIKKVRGDLNAGEYPKEGQAVQCQDPGWC